MPHFWPLSTKRCPSDARGTFYRASERSTGADTKGFDGAVAPAAEPDRHALDFTAPWRDRGPESLALYTHRLITEWWEQVELVAGEFLNPGGIVTAEGVAPVIYVFALLLRSMG